MGYAIHCAVGVKPDGTPYWDLWTTPQAEWQGVQHLSSAVSLDRLFEPGERGDYRVAVTLACSALGSRLLRLAGEINQQLTFDMDVPGGLK